MNKLPAPYSEIGSIVFFNHCNNGDLHVSRELVKWFIGQAREAGIQGFIYAHERSSRILRDLDGLGLQQVPIASNGLSGLTPESKCVENITLLDGLPAVALNTWYAASPVWNKGNGFGCTLNTLHALFADHFRRLFGSEMLEPVERFIPRVNWKHFQVERFSDPALLRRDGWRKLVFVSNGQPWSGQSRLDSGVFLQEILGLIGRHPDVLFLLSNKQEGVLGGKNVAFTADEIRLPEGQNDLMENGYLTTHCDVIIGRGSGAYSMAYTADNLLNPKKKMVCFTDDEKTAQWIYPPGIVKAQILWSPARDAEGVRAALESALS